MAAASHRPLQPRFNVSLPMFIFGCVLLHRLLQFYFVWPPLMEHSLRDDHIMQLLPGTVWREHFSAGLLYLQQAPPLPNLIFGALAWSLRETGDLSLAILGLQIIIASFAAAVFCRLLQRFQQPDWICLAAPLVLFFSGDLITMEYNVMGHFFYEQGTMLFCLLACHSALSVQQSGHMRSALWLGLWVALLALTRSTFSYFALPVVAWLLIVAPRKKWRVLALFLLPVLLLQGGWATKNAVVYGYWDIATSTWGGANARTGDVRRSGGDDVLQWMKQQQPFCEPVWWQMAQQYRRAIFFFPAKDRILSYPQPEAVKAANRRMAVARGQEVFFDTETVRLYSQCLQRIYLRYWLHHPLETLWGVWRSYQIFWLPIREFVARNQIPLSQPAIQEEDSPKPFLWLRHAIGELRGNAYRQAYLLRGEGSMELVFRDIRVLALPALPLIATTSVFVVFHLAGLYMISATCFRRLRPVPAEWLRLSFAVLCVAYVAGLTSLVEYGENMRFRLEVEPLIWLVSLVALQRFGLWLKCDFLLRYKAWRRPRS